MNNRDLGWTPSQEAPFYQWLSLTFIQVSTHLDNGSIWLQKQWLQILGGDWLAWSKLYPRMCVGILEVRYCTVQNAEGEWSTGKK
jgi:hypothetical protein